MNLESAKMLCLGCKKIEGCKIYNSNNKDIIISCNAMRIANIPIDLSGTKKIKQIIGGKNH